MPTTLTPGEREDREAEKLLDHKRRPSRKHKQRRAPRPWQRRKRMNVDDPDLSKKDKDLSLNHKGYSSTIGDLALRIMFAGKAKKEVNLPKPPAAPPSKDSKPPKPPKEKKNGIKKAVDRVYNLLHVQSPAVANSFQKYAEKAFSGGNEPSILENLDKIRTSLKTKLREVEGSITQARTESLVPTVISAWPKDPLDWAGRAAVVGALDYAMDSLPIPTALKTPFLRDKPGEVIQDKKLLRQIIEGASKNSSRSIDDDTVNRFAHLASIWHTVSQNPPELDAGSLKSGVKGLAQKIHDQSRDLARFQSIMTTWNRAMDEFQPRDKSGDWKPGDKLEDVMKDIDSFFSKKNPTIDPKASMEAIHDYSKSKFGEIPAELQSIFKGFKRKATSNGTEYIKDMAPRTAEYHGVIQQGHPTDTTNTPYKSIDARFIGEKHYKSIIKTAKVFLEEDWMNWEGGADDAKVRAALDLAIHTADESIYQGKIDPTTYEMLLNRLAGWGYDTFKDTVLPFKAENSRSASTMENQHFNNIVRVAQDLRTANPKAALEIMKNLRELVSTDANSQTIREHVATGFAHDETGAPGEPAAPPASGPEEHSAASPGDTLEFKSMSDDDFKKLKDDSKKLFDSKDIEEFMKGLDSLNQGLKKTGSLRTTDGTISISTLIKIADQNPGTRSVLLPILAAATKKKMPPKGGKPFPPKKKEEGKADKKEEKDEKKSEKKGPPKPAKGKPKARKSSVNLNSEDLNW